jgi:glucan phosphoethanolaminetransferase (alkaline phosphatase superfamily)
VVSLQYSYLFGFLPALMICAIDDILFHVRRVGPVLRMLLVGVFAFFLAALNYSSHGADYGVLQFVLYGMVGFIPATISSWLVHKYVDETPPEPNPQSVTEVR